jgi:hypothetical protein
LRNQGFFIFSMNGSNQAQSIGDDDEDEWELTKTTLLAKPRVKVQLGK